jgi:hypothetical protein
VISTEQNIHNQLKQSLQISFLNKVRGLCFVFVLLTLFADLNGNVVTAQDSTLTTPIRLTDTVPEKVHSPRKATIFALVLPGAGQVYNHKYWKVPIVYAGFAACIYFIVTNNKYYQEINTAYNYVSVTKKVIYPPTPLNYFPYPDPPNDWAINYDESQLKDGRDYYRRNLEISYIATGIWYLLTVVDATVDAHFFDYDISNDLTLNVKPWIPALGSNIAYGTSGGINLTLRF